MVEVAEMLPQFAAQSTAMLDNDVPPEIGDWYRLLAGLVAFGKAGDHRCILGFELAYSGTPPHAAPRIPPR
jgi:hypothetical protein